MFLRGGIGLLSRSTANQIAAIHKQQLEGSGFLAECSPAFIAFFYRRISADASTILLVEVESGETAGFIFCTEDASRYLKRFFIRSWFFLFLYPSCWLPVVKAVIMKARSARSLPEYQHELVDIAVHARFTGKGLAKRLIARAELELLHSNAHEYYLQVFANNVPALRLYESSHFETVAAFAARGRQKLLMKRLL